MSVGHTRNVSGLHTPRGYDWPFGVAVAALGVSLVSGGYAILLPIVHWAATTPEWPGPAAPPPWWPGIVGAAATAAASLAALLGGLRRRGGRAGWTTALAVAGPMLSACGIIGGLLLAARLSALPPP